MGKPIPVSKGFDDTTHFIQNLKNAFKKKEPEKLKIKIAAEVEVGKTKTKMLKETYDPKRMSSEDILEFVDNYIKLIQKAKIDTKYNK